MPSKNNDTLQDPHYSKLNLKMHVRVHVQQVWCKDFPWQYSHLSVGTIVWRLKKAAAEQALFLDRTAPTDRYIGGQRNQNKKREKA